MHINSINSKKYRPPQAPSLALLVLALVVFLPAIFTGGRETLAAPLLAGFLALFLLLQVKQNTPLPPRFSATALTLFLLWACVQTFFFSAAPYRSLELFLSLTLGGFVYGASMGLDKEQLARIVLGAGALFACIGLVFFLQSQSYGYLRLGSTFYSHNAFSGFLILPSALSLWFLWGGKKSVTVYAFVLVSLLCTTFILTFSRGGFVSVGVTVALMLALFYRASADKRVFLKKIGLTAIALLLGGTVAYGIFTIKKIQGVREVVAVTTATPYASETDGGNGITARLQYFEHALGLWIEKPLIGHGLGSFGQEARRIQTDVGSFSLDPHNIYLQILAELGLVGGVLFFIFLASIVVRGGLFIRHQKAEALQGTFFVAFVGLLLHSAVEPNFQFPALITIFFLVAAAATVSTDRERMHAAPKLLYAMLAVTMAIFLVVTSAHVSALWFGRASRHLRNDNRDGFVASYTRAVRWNPLNPYLRITGASMLAALGEHERADQEITTALRLHPSEQKAYMVQAALSYKSGDLHTAKEAYTTAISLAPFKDIGPTTALIRILLEEKDYAGAARVFHDLERRFPHEAFDSPLWIDPHKDAMREQMQSFQKIFLELQRGTPVTGSVD